MRLTRALLAVPLLLLAAVACDDQPTDSTGRPDPGSPSPTASYPPNVVHLDGIGPIRFGENRLALVGKKLIVPAEELGCEGQQVYDVPGYVDAADLIFNSQDKLGFVWVLSPGVRTPEQVSVESPLDAVRKAYPDAEELPESERSFPGLLVKGEKTGYLFLYEPKTREVVKLLAGFVDILRDAQKSGITC
jgi:hypothetical protein